MCTDADIIPEDNELFQYAGDLSLLPFVLMGYNSGGFTKSTYFRALKETQKYYIIL